MLNRTFLTIHFPLLMIAATGIHAAAQSPEVKQDKKGRMVMREDRPQTARGWVVVAKSTYWPLCYEALDHLEQARSQIGSEDQEAFADSLEKSGAWLKLAASAAMTHGKAGIVFTGELLTDVSEKIRAGSSTYTADEYQKLITLAEICMAKSHVIRAASSDFGDAIVVMDKKQAAEKKLVSSGLPAASTEARENQLTYDVQQAVRHLQVAHTYLQAAAKSGRIQLPAAVSAEIPTLPADSDAEAIISFDESELQDCIDVYTQFVEEQRGVFAEPFVHDDVE